MQEILHIINEMSPYLLLGFLIAGLLHVFLPTRYYHKYLSKPTFGSVVNAAIFGIPLPLCSCGVIPTAMSLRKEGASKGAVTSFLISTPQTGVDSILATFGMMGLPFALVRPIAAMTTALFGGAAANLMDKDQAAPTASVRCCCDDEEEHGNKLVRVLRYAYVEMFGDIAKRLVIGLLLAGVITILVPDHFFEIFAGNTLASMLLVLCIAIPMYICATGSIPIAVALMMNGLTPGSALVLLMAGPACNIASILVVKQVLGLKSLVIYVSSIVLGAIGFGCLIDYLQFGGYVDFLGQLSMGSAACCHATDAWWQWACSGLLAVLLLNVFLRPNRHHDHETESNENTMTYTIKGMNCNHCRMTAENALKEVEGVTSATVVLETGEARVEGTATEEALRQAVEMVGFKLISNK